MALSCGTLLERALVKTVTPDLVRVRGRLRLRLRARLRVRGTRLLLRHRARPAAREERGGGRLRYREI